MRCGWIEADLANDDETEPCYRSAIMAGRVREMAKEAGDSELARAAVELAEYHEKMAWAARRCDEAIHQMMKKLERFA